jgi:hypothetical protein
MQEKAWRPNRLVALAALINALIPLLALLSLSFKNMKGIS